MQRVATRYLETWLGHSIRQPLVVRGARQVGKTWLVRDLAKRSGLDLVEINFERDPHVARFFKPGDPRKVLDDLGLVLGREIEPSGCLLFLDEIQAASQVLPTLRWFSEELSDLPVIAAGSLLDFLLAEHDFSIPVGRIGYLQVEPMTFAEYLLALGEDRLLERLDEWRVGGTLSSAVHERATALFARYSMVGGMPRVVAADVAGNDPRECRRLQHDLVATYRDDFTKYTGRMDARILDMVLLAVAAQLGRKFIYARVSEGVKQHQAKHSLDLLDKARLCHIVCWSAANGIPLGGEVKDSFRKIILLDVGLLHSLLGTPAYSSFPKWEILSSQVRGQLLEQITGQQLRALAADPSDEPRLYYWQREGGRPGEIDFLIQVHHHIVPVELKAGAAGAMKSLHQFMYDKRLGLAVRLDSNPPSAQDLDLKTTQSDRVLYRLISLPHYLAWNIEAIIIDHM